MKEKKLGIKNELRRSGVKFGIALIRKFSDGLFKPSEIADALGLDAVKPMARAKKQPTRKSSSGSKHSTKRKYTIRRGRKPRMVAQYTKAGEFVTTFPSAADAAREYSVHVNSIRLCLAGHQKTSAGFKWSYV